MNLFNIDFLNFGWFEILQVVLLFLFLYITKFYYEYFNRKNPLDGPIPLPLIGNLHNTGINLHKGLNKLSKKYGDTFEIYIMSYRLIIISDTKDVKKVYNCSPKDIFFGRLVVGTKEYDMSKTIGLSNDYQSWKYNRKRLSHAVLSPKVLKEFVVINQKQFDKSMKYWQSKYETEKELVVNFAKWAKTYTADSSFRLTTGIPGYALDFYNKVSLYDLKK